MNPQNQTAPHDPAGAVRPTRQEAGGVEYWRIARVARYLDITTKRVYQLVQEKKLTAIHLGPRSTRVLRQSIEDYVALFAEREESS